MDVVQALPDLWREWEVLRTARPAPSLTVRELGEQLMGPHTAALLVVGLLLTVALLGAVLLAADERPDQPEDAP